VIIDPSVGFVQSRIESIGCLVIQIEAEMYGLGPGIEAALWERNYEQIWGKQMRVDLIAKFAGERQKPNGIVL